MYKGEVSIALGDYFAATLYLTRASTWDVALQRVVIDDWDKEKSCVYCELLGKGCVKPEVGVRCLGRRTLLSE